MTQVVPILIMAAVLAADRGFTAARPLPVPGVAGYLLVTIVPLLLVVAVAGIASRRDARRIDAGGGGAAVRRAERSASLARSAVLFVHVAAFATWDVLGAIRAVVGDPILLDELVAVVPPVMTLLLLWAVYFPIERRIRVAMVLRRLDESRPVYQPPTLGGYVLAQFRLHLALMLVPILLVVAVAETIVTVLPAVWTGVDPWVVELATASGGLLVFLLAPLAARSVLDVVPLERGDVFDDLAEVCRRHRVRVRRFLLWQTEGAVVNAAVMGLIGPLRYVLLTDGLIEGLPREQVRAVIAHEVGHVRAHHMPWLVGSLLVALLVTGLVTGLAITGVESAFGRFSDSSVPWIEGGQTLVSLVVALAAFGWISRRYERHADVFAVRDLCEPGESVVQAPAVDAMCGALESVARLGGMPLHRRSWRHGSIAWRIAHLQSLINQPVDRLPIDRVVRRMRVVVILAAILVAGAMVWLAQSPVVSGGAA